MSESIRKRAETMPLHELLRLGAGALRHLQPPATLRERVLASAGRAWPVPPAPRRWRWARAGSGMLVGGAALALALALLLAAAPEAQRHDAMRAASGFVPVASAGRWQQLLNDSATPAWLVSTELPRERLAALGLPYDPARAAEPVRAELLLHASGEVIALRVIGE